MITKFLILFQALLLILACFNYPQKIRDEKFQLVQRINGKVLKVKDTTEYSPDFINGLRDLSPEYDSLFLIDDKIIMTLKPFNGREYVSVTHTTKIPMVLPLNKAVVYDFVRADKNYTLILKRINFTDVQYELKSNNHVVKSGKAVLPGGFLLGSETNKDDNGSYYEVIEYYDKKECWISLRIELETGNRASINISCKNDDTQNMKISQFRKRPNAL